MKNGISIKSSGTLIGRAVAINIFVSNPFFTALAFLIWAFGIISLLAVLSDALLPIYLPGLPLRIANLLVALFLAYLPLRTFYIMRVSKPKLLQLNDEIAKIQNSQAENLYCYFSMSLAKAWNRFASKDPDISDTGKLLVELLKSPDADFILNRMGFGDQAMLPYIEKYPSKFDACETVYRALEIAAAESHHRIETGDLLIALSETEQSLKAFLGDIHLDTQDLANIVYWQTSVIRDRIKNGKRVFDPDDLKLSGGIGRDWIYGFTPLLKQFSQDLTDTIIKYGLNLHAIGHDREIKEMEESLTRERGGNVLLVGEPGIGKKTVVMGFARKVAEGRAIGNLKNKHLVQINIDALLAGVMSGGEITQRISAILNETAYAGNAIIFIENIQNLFSSGDAGKVNAAEVIIPYLDGQGLYFIGTCDIASYNKYIATNSSLSEKFTKINIDEPQGSDMIRILEDVVPTIEGHTGCLITYNTIKQAVKDADKYIMNIPNPEKSINLLDGAAAKAVSNRGQTIVVEQDIDEYVAEKYDVPTDQVGDDEREKLLNLESTMHQRVIGQAQAIDAISNALRRARAGIVDSKKPIGSFLFMGTTGVGKTETAKALAEAYFGDEERMIRFDMSEFQNKEDIYRLIGSNIQGDEEPGLLTSAVREHPFSLLLFDELEKANPDILNLFLQILDEGHLTDGSGRKVSFTNNIIIATSNAGSAVIKQSINSGVEYETLKKHLIDYVVEYGVYKPEFINRFTGLIVFSPLSRAEIEQIAALMIQNLANDLKKNKGVGLQVSSDAVKFLAQMGYDPVMGARPMSRTIQDKIEDTLAKKLLAGELNRGDTLSIAAADLG